MRIPSKFEAVFLLGVALFICHLRIDLSLVNPTNVDWMWRADWAGHYLGWLFFRYENWHFPPGIMQNYLASQGTSIGLTDSIPLAAYFFKAFRDFLPMNFQYFGLWYLGSLFLQGYFANRLLIYFVPSSLFVSRLLLCAVVMMAPPLMWRHWHIALCSHWLILWGFCLYFEPQKNHSIFSLFALSLLAAGIHPYLAAMVAMLSIATLLKWAKGRSGKNSLIFFLKSVFLVLVINLFSFYLHGYFYIKGSLLQSGFGFYSANLLSFFHPHNLPVILPNLPHTEGQYEGFSYLGLGIILVVLVLLFTQPRSIFFAISKYWQLGLICTFLLLFSLSSKIYFAQIEVVNLEKVYSLLGQWPQIFRASGRFIWPSYYLLLMFAIVKLLQVTATKNKYLFFLVLGLQFIDVSRHVVYPRTPDRILPREEALNLFKGFEGTSLKIVDVASEESCNIKPPNHAEDWLYYPLLEVAAQRSLAVNIGFSSRQNFEQRSLECLFTVRGLLKGNIKPQTIYIFMNPQANWISEYVKKNAKCRQITQATACFVDRESQEKQR